VKLREINSIFNKLHEQVIKTNHIPVYKHMKNKIFIMYGLTSRNLRPNPVFTSISVLLCERSNGMSTSVWRGFTPVFVNYTKGCTRLAAASDKVYQLFAHGRWFSPGTPAYSTTKTGRHDIAEILLKVAFTRAPHIEHMPSGFDTNFQGIQVQKTSINKR
jgi:hypothetical protein